MLLFADEEVKVETVEVTETKTETTTAAPTKEIVADAKPAEAKKPERTANRRPGGNGRPPQRRNNNRRGRPPSEFEEKVIDIARVTTVVKGGRRFSFSALVVIGNKKGKVGWGHGKAKEVPDAIRKSILDAKTNMIEVPIIDKRTVPHDQIGKFLASQVLVKPAPKGKGIIASGSIRAVVELAGYKDIYTKSLGSRSKTNSVKAVINALSQLRKIEDIARLRDVKVEDIIG
ncbi:MAG: 30S ribosomal protein S5 [Mycoplasmataceae bacterium]|nr:30S ribosomal protein S5 [Mycoplasmataceae bacterium]